MEEKGARVMVSMQGDGGLKEVQMQITGCYSLPWGCCNTKAIGRALLGWRGIKPILTNRPMKLKP